MTSPGYPSLYDPNDQRQPPVKPGEELAGKYRVDRVIGAGAMGVVVQAWHVELEQQVAVKFLYPEYARNADGAERFRREARSAAKIKNQHVARVLDVGTVEGKNIPFIVMEYLEGKDLARVLAEHGSLPAGTAVNYVMQACEAVAEAHEHGIVHRDLKPANLFLAEGPHGARMIKVLDFGISKVNAGGAQQFSLTDTATLMGSPAYMSPEQLESSRNVDGRADIWSLGVILHELILGRVPFNGDSVPQLVRAILTGARPSLRERDGSLEDLEHVVARCLSQDREQRFESAVALQEALRPFAEGASTSSRNLPSAAASQDSSKQSTPASAAVAATEAAQPGDPPNPGAREGSSGVPSAWGHTQRGRQRPWQRRGIPAVVVAVSGLGLYWAGSSWFEKSPQAPAPGAAARPPPVVAAQVPSPIPPPPPASEPPKAPAPVLPAPAGEREIPRVRPVAGGPTRESPPQPEKAPPPVSATRPAAPAPVPARVAAKPAAAPKPGSDGKAQDTSSSRAALEPAGAADSAPSAAGAAPPATATKPAPPEAGDKPKPEPSPRKLDLTNFGGRE